MTLKKKIKSKDMFGHPIHLSFNGSVTHQTTLGGFFSILIYIALGSFCLLKLKLMWTYSNDNITSNTDHIDFDAVGNITLGHD